MSEHAMFRTSPVKPKRFELKSLIDEHRDWVEMKAYCEHFGFEECVVNIDQELAACSKRIHNFFTRAEE